MADFRRWILAFAALALVLGSVVPASAQTGGLVCNATLGSVTPSLRHEGFTELTGDILLTCNGAPGSTPTPPGSFIPQATVSVSLSAPVTSRIFSGASPQALTDALLLVDDPSLAEEHVCPAPTNPTIACRVPGDNGQTFKTNTKYNVFQGLGCTGITCVPGPNTITFLGVPVDPAATTTTFRITNIRVDATNVGASGPTGNSPVFAYVTVSPTSALQLSTPQFTVGTVGFGMNVGTAPLNPSFLQCETSVQTPVGTITFTENFGTAFKVKTNGVQNIPGGAYNSESGLQIILPAGTTTGVADTPTELQTVISNIPVGAVVWVDAFANSSGAICATGQSGASCTLPSYANLIAPTGSVPTTVGVPAIVKVADNSAGTAPISVTVVWSIIATNPQALDSLPFNVYVSFTGQPGSPTTITGPATAVSGFSPQAAAATVTEGIPTFSSTILSPPGTPSTLFTVAQCQTILLFPYVTDFTGFDTGVAISNTSLDSLGTLSPKSQEGACVVSFFSGGALATALDGMGGSAMGTLTSPVIPAGETWAFSLSGLDPGYPGTPSVPNGYAIATCQFQFAHGYSFVSDFGVRNFAAAYLALIIPDASRSAQPFTCSQNGGVCTSYTGEQLVH